MLFLLLSRIVNWAIDVYITILFIRMILDWAFVLAPRWRPAGVVASLIDVIYRLTEPPLRWLRRYIRPIPMGAVYFDVSFLVLYFALVVLRILI
ncbi:YggT family protein [Bifidobacterium aerophilum]|uniref:YggT family protein n=1 Tax=Bifidobacterium aerophilum TaxID=1798155 RepID=A0A6N9Z4B7_9BIFI|nr:YggT family protein [Bifidobacterium aerophilum]NEG88995.1 YggT family protein [Bifidobacterium aerophilum]